MILCLCLLSACGKSGGDDVGGDDNPSSQTDTDTGETPPASGSDTPHLDSPASDSDMSYVMTNKTLLIGYTEGEPMHYAGDDGVFTGFDRELAVAVCGMLSLTPEFVEIDWNKKDSALVDREIDCVWSALAITPKLQAEMCLSLPYAVSGDEAYCVAFRGSSNLDYYVNAMLRELAQDGTLQALCEKYGLSVAPELDATQK